MKDYEQRRATEHPGDAAAYARDGHIDMLEEQNAELLEACEAAADLIERHNRASGGEAGETLLSIQDAIRKAKGLPNG
jgi:hypothetical protein